MDEKQLRREIALAITNLRGVKLVATYIKLCTSSFSLLCVDEFSTQIEPKLYAVQEKAVLIISPNNSGV